MIIYLCKSSRFHFHFHSYSILFYKTIIVQGTSIIHSRKGTFTTTIHFTTNITTFAIDLVVYDGIVGVYISNDMIFNRPYVLHAMHTCSFSYHSHIILIHSHIIQPIETLLLVFWKITNLCGELSFSPFFHSVVATTSTYTSTWGISIQTRVTTRQSFCITEIRWRWLCTYSLQPSLE